MFWSRKVPTGLGVDDKENLRYDDPNRMKKVAKIPLFGV